MRLMPKAFSSRHPSPAKVAGRTRAPNKRLLFEPLETRAMLSTVPFYIENSSTIDTKGTLAFADNQIHIAIYGQDYATTPSYYYFDKTGAPALTTSVGSGVVPTFLLSDLTYVDGHKYVIDLPTELAGDPSNGIQSARMYFSMGTDMSLTINGDGSVNALTPDTSSYFDFVEFSLNAPTVPATPGNLNIDTTNVDQFGVPIKVTVDSSDTSKIGDATDREDHHRLRSLYERRGRPVCQLGVGRLGHVRPLPAAEPQPRARPDRNGGHDRAGADVDAKRGRQQRPRATRSSSTAAWPVFPPTPHSRFASVPTRSRMRRTRT